MRRPVAALPVITGKEAPNRLRASLQGVPFIATFRLGIITLKSRVNLFHPQIAAALAATISLAACIAPPAAPTIPVAPRPSKMLEMFGADQAACQQNAAAQLSPAVAAANNQAVGVALLGGALERGWVPGSARPQATPAKGRRLARPLAAPSGSSATRMARLIRRSRCSSSTT